MTSTTYFHYAGIKLAPGSIIEPGNWGRMVRLYPTNADANNAWRLARELVFEQVREREFPKLPSRLNSCFVFESRDHARSASNGMNGYWNLLYEVELVQPDLARHRGDFDLLSACMQADNTPFLAKATRSATSYWSGVIHSNVPEILTASPLRVIRSVQQASI